MPVCSICGQEMICTNPHAAPEHQLGSPIKDCPLKKGAIYVYVKDDAGDPVEGVKVTSTGGNPDSDKVGFAVFDPLDEGKHPTSIELGGLSEKYYIFSSKSVEPQVTAGRITFVEFQLNRYAPLKVRVKRSDTGTYLKDVEIKVATDTADAAPTVPQQNSLEDKPIEFPKLKRTLYKVAAALGGTDKDNFVFDDDKFNLEHVINPAVENLVEFVVSPSGWIAFKVIDEKDKSLDVVAKFELEQAGKEKMEKDTLADTTLRVDKLQPGNFKVHGVTVPECYELVEFKSA